MFTINIKLKLALIAVLLIGGIALAVAYGFWYAFPLLLVGLILLVSYVLLGTVQSAAQIVQDGDYIAAEKRLNMTLKPEWLYRPNRSYYYMMKGTIATALKRGNEETEKWLNKANEIGYQSDNEQAMVSMQMVGMAIQKNNWNQARSQFKLLKDLDVTEPQLIDQIKQMEMAIKNRGAIRNARVQTKGQMTRGSKRRRPKMR